MNLLSAVPTLIAPPRAYAICRDARPRADGKFVYVGEDKFWIRGVTYGPFGESGSTDEYHSPEQVALDFGAMAVSGINTVRTYTVPPVWFLDRAAQHGLYVLVGLPWEQHIAFLDDKKRPDAIEARVRNGVRVCAGHPALLGFAVGNEIPASIVRWHGPQRIARFLERLYCAAKTEDPEALVTYVNYPSTEYLDLPFLDLVSFNVFLESPAQLDSYLARLQNIADERPLLLSEIGLDSRRNGLQTQAHTLEWQIRSAFSVGCAGVCVFSWTDEWHRGGQDILNWDFGLTDRGHRPKPALGSVRKAFRGAPFRRENQWPRISVIVCSYNGARTIRDCCEGLARVDYPNFDVIVVDDGSKDRTADIANEYGFNVIRTGNHGLSHARNIGMRAATGEILAYLDDDTSPDPDWLTYLAHTFFTTGHAAAGGPNIAPAGEGLIAECVSHAPGNPVQVLLADQEAEHIPGCNLAIRKTCLEAIGGFDVRFRLAGDDVDVCWRLRERGWTLGFNPAAVVWHHRRNSMRAYWKQQRGYGKAEALLERKWPEKYNAVGHLSWKGRLYGKGLRETLQWPRQRIYHGTFGSALFQSVYDASSDGYWWLPLMPEWYLIIAAFAILSFLGLAWLPMLVFLVPFVIACGTLIAQAALAAAKVPLLSRPYPLAERIKRRLLIFLFHLMQPLARLIGRRWDGLAISDRPARGFKLPLPRTFSFWHERWQSAQERLERVERRLRQSHIAVIRGGTFDGWDLEVRLGLLSSVRLLLAIEEHGAGRQLVRVRADPRWSDGGRGIIGIFEVLAGAAALAQQPMVFVLLLGVACMLVARSVMQCATTMKAVVQALNG